MFNDKRSKKIAFVAHCILNQNSISDGTADYPHALTNIVKLLYKHKIGIIQMPCPEIHCIGLDRGNADGYKSDVLVENTRIRESLMSRESTIKLDSLANQVLFQIVEYKKMDSQ